MSEAPTKRRRKQGKPPRILHTEHRHPMGDSHIYKQCRAQIIKTGEPLVMEGYGPGGVRIEEPVGPAPDPEAGVGIDPDSAIARRAMIVAGKAREALAATEHTEPEPAPVSTRAKGMGLDTMRGLIEALEVIEEFVAERGALGSATIRLLIDDLNVECDFVAGEGWEVRVL